MNRKKKLYFWLALFVYLGITLLMTYPLPFHAGSRVRDYGDSLLNTWILTTVANKIAHFEWRHFFSANIFYPEKNPLLYSELLIPQALIALPIIKITENPVLAHNLVLLLALLTSAMAMFSLAYYLTSQFFPALFAGVIFAFCPFMIAHLFQIQIISAAGLPLTFLFLHRYFRSGRFIDWLHFTWIYLLQSLANFYYALFMIIFTGTFIFLGAISQKTYRQKKFWGHVGLFIFLFGLILGPIFLAYAQQQAQEGFARTIGAQASLKSYLTTARINWLYGEWSARFRQPEGELFPGVVPLGLALLALIPLPFSQRNWLKKDKEAINKNRLILFYAFILLLGILFSLGTKGPFYFWHRFIPGYRAIRAVTRFHVYTMLALAVLASFGLNKLLILIKRGYGLNFLKVFLLALLIIEYLSIPIPLRPIASSQNMPQIYQELKRWPSKKVILELPLPEPGSGIGRIEGPRLYYSLFHGHYLVNGYSGFFSPVYLSLRQRLNQQSLEENLRFWREIGINLIILHCEELGVEDCPYFVDNFKKSDQLIFIGQYGEDFLFSLI